MTKLSFIFSNNLYNKVGLVNNTMKKLLLLLLVLCTLTACQPAQAVLSTPTSTSSPATPSETPTDTLTPNPTPTHSPEPITSLDMSGYKLLAGDGFNDLRPVAVNGEIVYLADHSFDILFMISSEMIIELLPQHAELHTLIERDQRLEWDPRRALPPGAHGKIC